MPVPVSLRRGVAGCLAAIVAGGGVAAVGGPALAAPPTPPASVQWGPCPDGGAAVPPGLECGTVTVPLDYDRPAGRTVAVAVSRLRATRPQHRRGVLLLNWGGPGWNGTTLPGYLAGSRAGALAEEFDLIGFDPRGTGASSPLACQAPGGADPQPGDPAETPEDAARRDAQRFAEWAAACAATDPELTRALTVQNVARDLDRIRAALGERRISYLGVSWGTRLGVTFRSMFPQRVDRMLLDSVFKPTADISTAEMVPGMERSFERFSAWLAARDARFHLGTDPAAVRATLLALRDRLREEPMEIAGGRLTGDDLSVICVFFQETWDAGGRLLAALQTGDQAAAVTAIGDFYALLRWPSASSPLRYNSAANTALICNDISQPGTFEEFWAAHQEQVRRYPMAGGQSPTHSDCAGWPYRPDPAPVLHRPGSLQLVGHTDEWNTPPAWAAQMRRAVGGALGYVDDDVHGSLVRSPCADLAVRYLRTGETFGGHCPGVSPPA